MESFKGRKIRWGIIGLGKIAHKFASDLLTIDDAELYAVASRTQEKADKFAEKYKAEKGYSSYGDLANDSKVDAVYIATPHPFHKENTILCLKNGIAVLCEKPFAMNSEEVHEMIDCAMANNVLLMEALWTYFLPHYNHVLELIKNETYGKIFKLEADFGFKQEYDQTNRVIKKDLGGGSLLDIGIYPIFAALTTLGNPAKIEAQATFFENDVDSSCTMTFEYKNGIKAHLKSTLLEETPTAAIFHCEKGTIKINPRFHEPSTVTITSNGKEETLDFDCSTIGYNYEVIHFNDLLRQGKIQSDVMTFSFSKKLMKYLDKVSQIIGLEY